MPSTFSPILKLELIATGEQATQWGNTTNVNLGTALEESITGIAAVAMSDADFTFTVSNVNTTQAFRHLVLNVSGALSAARNLVVPTIQKHYIVWNNTTGGFAVTVKTAAGTGVAVPAGAKMHLMVDGTNVVQAVTDVTGGVIVSTAGAQTLLSKTIDLGSNTLTGTLAQFNAAVSDATLARTDVGQTFLGDNTFSNAVTLTTAGTTTDHAVRADRTITAGDGLTGGGDFTANRTVTLGTPGTITGSSTNNVTTTSHTHALTVTAADATYTNTTSGLAATTVQAAIDEIAVRVPSAQFSWDNSSTTTPVAKPQVLPVTELINTLHARLRGCLLLDNGQVNYYLNPTNWAQKEDGSASDLTGADGMVMVEVPRFYVRNGSSGNTWKPLLSPVPLAGYTVHPAFVRNGVEVPYRYRSAYDCCVYDGANFIETDNNDNQSARVNTATDKLVSVSGKFPMAGLTRNEFRLLAANRGAGWSIGTFTLWSAIGLLFASEYQTFDAQTAIGVGNTRHTTWPSGGTFATDNRTCESGLGNALGNGSGGSATGTINTSNNDDYSKYRGFENFWGNVWNWEDGINIFSQGNTAGDKVFAYWSNTTSDFADNTATDYGLLGEIANTLNNTRYATQFSLLNAWALVPTAFSTTGTHGTTDFYRTNSGWRVLLVGGNAANGALAGVFAFLGNNASSIRNRSIGARLEF